MLFNESLGTVFREIHFTMHNLAVGISSSQVGKVALCSFSGGFSDGNNGD